jgi:hypothetical protein
MLLRKSPHLNPALSPHKLTSSCVGSSRARAAVPVLRARRKALHSDGGEINFDKFINSKNAFWGFETIYNKIKRVIG